MDASQDKDSLTERVSLLTTSTSLDAAGGAATTQKPAATKIHYAFQWQLNEIDFLLSNRPHVVRIMSSARNPSTTLVAWSDGVVIYHPRIEATKSHNLKKMWANFNGTSQPLTTWDARRANFFEGATEIWPMAGWSASDREKEDSGDIDRDEESATVDHTAPDDPLPHANETNSEEGRSTILEPSA